MFLNYGFGGGACTVRLDQRHTFLIIWLAGFLRETGLQDFMMRELFCYLDSVNGVS